MGTILKIIIIGGLAWGYFACVQGLSNKALAELNGIRQMYSVENIQASLAEKRFSYLALHGLGLYLGL